jgi:hypothetical protein
MSQVIYLSPKVASKSTLIFVQINNHNPKGYVERSNGKAIRLYQKLNNGDQNDCSGATKSNI